MHTDMSIRQSLPSHNPLIEAAHSPLTSVLTTAKSHIKAARPQLQVWQVASLRLTHGSTYLKGMMTQQGVSVKGGKIYERPAPARSPPRSPRWPMEWKA